MPCLYNFKIILAFTSSSLTISPLIIPLVVNYKYFQFGYKGYKGEIKWKNHC